MAGTVGAAATTAPAWWAWPGTWASRRSGCSTPTAAGQVSDLISAYGYARTQGLKIVNASLGGGSFSLAERDAIAAASNTLFVVAAGNGGSDGMGDDNDSVPTYPCAYDLPNIDLRGRHRPARRARELLELRGRSVDLAAPA